MGVELVDTTRLWDAPRLHFGTGMVERVAPHLLCESHYSGGGGTGSRGCLRSGTRRARLRIIDNRRHRVLSISLMEIMIRKACAGSEPPKPRLVPHLKRSGKHVRGRQFEVGAVRTRPGVKRVLTSLTGLPGSAAIIGPLRCDRRWRRKSGSSACSFATGPCTNSLGNFDGFRMKSPVVDQNCPWRDPWCPPSTSRLITNGCAGVIWPSGRNACRVPFPMISR